MSAYFQRLLRQSGVHLSSAPAPAVSVPLGPRLSPATPSEPSAHEVVEVHEERVTSPSRSNVPLIPAPESVPLSSGQASVATAPSNPSSPGPRSTSSDPATERVVIQTVDTIEKETVTIAPSAARTASVTPPAAAVAASAPSTTPSAPAGSALSPEFPAEVMQAVMKWIAAGSTPAGSPASPAREISDLSEKPAADTPASPAPARAPTPREGPKIPDRVIQIVEEHIGEAAASSRSEVRAAAAAGQSAPAFASPPESPVRVSIGSIQVRIDAPAPAPARMVRPSGSARSASAPAPRSGSGLSQLRRHYIIPH